MTRREPVLSLAWMRDQVTAWRTAAEDAAARGNPHAADRAERNARSYEVQIANRERCPNPRPYRREVCLNPRNPAPPARDRG